MAFVDGKHDGLADQRLAQHALGVNVTLVQNLLELAHDGAVAFGDREAALQCGRVHGDGVFSRKNCFDFSTGLRLHARPVQLGFLDIKVTFCGGFDGLGLVNLIRDQVAFADRVFQFIGERRFFNFKEAQRVAQKGFVFAVGTLIILRGSARCGRHPDLDAIKVFQHSTPLAVNAAVALVADDQVKVTAGIVGIEVDHALQRGDGDTLFVLKTSPGAQHVGGEVG